MGSLGARPEELAGASWPGGSRVVGRCSGTEEPRVLGRPRRGAGLGGDTLATCCVTWACPVPSSGLSCIVFSSAFPVPSLQTLEGSGKPYRPCPVPACCHGAGRSPVDDGRRPGLLTPLLAPSTVIHLTHSCRSSRVLTVWTVPRAQTWRGLWPAPALMQWTQWSVHQGCLVLRLAPWEVGRCLPETRVRGSPGCWNAGRCV